MRRAMEEQRRQQGQGNAAAAAAAANPGAAAFPRQPGADGEGAGPGGTQRNSSFAKGSAEDIVLQFADAVIAGDMEAAGKLVGSKAKGQLASIRNGSASSSQMDQLKAYLGTMDFLSRRVLGRTIQSTFRGGSNKVLQFKSEKENAAFVLTDLTVVEAQKRPGR
jgi:hypothetical protein